MIQFLEEIQEQFKKYYPREGCGVLAVSKGELKWFPCDNVATDQDDFIIDSRQYLDIAKRYDIVGIVHSHPDSSCEPSEADIKACNAIGKPYYIFSYPEMEMHLLEPQRDTKPLYGREYEFGVTDCFEAMRDYLQTQNIEIPARAAFEDDWWERGLDYFTDEVIKDYGYSRVEGNMQENDVLIFTVRSVVGNHCGVYLGDDIFYHHAENRLSCRENLYPFWKKYLTGVYRYDA
jgi:proteasome lid subunit RPN8/RPN11